MIVTFECINDPKVKIVLEYQDLADFQREPPRDRLKRLGIEIPPYTLKIGSTA